MDLLLSLQVGTVRMCWPPAFPIHVRTMVSVTTHLTMRALLAGVHQVGKVLEPIHPVPTLVFRVSLNLPPMTRRTDQYYTMLIIV